MSNNKYIDFDLMRKYPNKYNLTPSNINKLIINDWEQLKKETWNNQAMKDTGNWWCHLEGCQKGDSKYSSEDEFWIGFREDDNKIRHNFTCFDGMCKYVFKKFYNIAEIENRFDMQVQVNAIKWLNSMIDRNILKMNED